MTVKLRPLRQSRTQLRSTRAGARMLVHPKGLHENALSDFIRWCPTEPGYTVVAVEVPPKTAPEALEDVLEDLAACPGVLRLIPSRLGTDSTLEFGNWLAQRLGRTVVAHQGSVMIVPGGGLYIPSGEEDVGWLRFEPGAAPVPHSRRFPRPSWDSEQFAEPRDLGPYATLEPLPAGAWIRPAVETPDVLAFRRWLIGSVAVDPLLPRVVLGYPGSPMPTIAAVAEFWRSLPAALQPGVRFAGFGGTDEGMTPYGQQLADALDAPVVLGNGVQLASPSAAGGNEMRTVLRHGVMSWSPYVGDLGYLPVRSTGGVPTDPVAIGHRAPIAGLQEREPGVYEYSHDAVLEVTQSGLWMRSPALPADSFHVRTEHPNPAHVMVVFDASTHANTHRMQLLATEMVERLEPRVRSVARILASTATGAARRIQANGEIATLDSPPETPAEPDESNLNITALADDDASAQPPAPLAIPGVDPADVAAGMATIHVPIATLLASLQADAQSAPARPASDSGLVSEGVPNWPDEPVPPAVALYALSWPAQPDADKEPEADLVSRTVAEVRREQAARRAVVGEPTVMLPPVADDKIAMVADAATTDPPPPTRPALVSNSAILATPAPQLVSAPAPAPADTPPAQLTLDPVVETAPPAPATAAAPAAVPPTQLTSDPVDVPPAQSTPGPVEVPPAQLTPDPVEAAPAQPAPSPAAAPAAQFTVTRRRPRKGRTVPAAPAAVRGTDTEPQNTDVVDTSTQPPDAPTITAPTAPPQTPATPIPTEFVPNAVPTIVQPEPQTPTPVPERVVQAPAVSPAPTAQPTPQPIVEPDKPTPPAPQPVVEPGELALPAPQPVEEPGEPAPPVPQPVVEPDKSTPPAPQAVEEPHEPAPPVPQPIEEPDEPIQYGAFQLVSSSADLSFGAPSAPAAPAPEKPRPVVPTPPAPAPASPVTPPPAPPISNAAPVAPMPLPQNQAPVVSAPRPVQPQPLPMQQPVQPPAPTAPVQPPPIENAPPAPAVQPATDVPASAKRRPAKSTVRVQPVPTAQCSVLPRDGGLAKERDWLRRNLSKQYDATASSVARILSEYPGLRAGSSASDTDVLTDLVALRLYLTGKIGGLDDAVRAAKVGPHVPLARCVAAGLRRLPSYRGPLRTRASLTDEQVRWYGARSLVTEWSFLPAIASAGLELPGSAEILIWSMSARRTGLLDPSRPDQVVFPPGTSFKVLSVGSGDGGPEVRLRELTRTEIAPDGTVQSMPALDEFAVAALEEAGKAWRQEDPVEGLPADRKDWFAAAPGLLAQPAAVGAAGPAKKGESA
jgi:hypothetical protein